MANFKPVMGWIRYGREEVLLVIVIPISDSQKHIKTQKEEKRKKSQQHTTVL